MDNLLFIIIAGHLLVGFGYMMYKLTGKKAKPEE